MECKVKDYPIVLPKGMARIVHDPDFDLSEVYRMFFSIYDGDEEVSNSLENLSEEQKDALRAEGRRFVAKQTNTACEDWDVKLSTGLMVIRPINKK
jgi:hypothetical protein